MRNLRPAAKGRKERFGFGSKEHTWWKRKRVMGDWTCGPSEGRGGTAEERTQHMEAQKCITAEGLLE